MVRFGMEIMQAGAKFLNGTDLWVYGGSSDGRWYLMYDGLIVVSTHQEAKDLHRGLLISPKLDPEDEAMIFNLGLDIPKCSY